MSPKRRPVKAEGLSAYPAQAVQLKDALQTLNSTPAFGGGGAGRAYGSDADQELADVAAKHPQRRQPHLLPAPGRWVDSQLSSQQEANARRIKQFSDEYFELARRHGRTLSQYMVFDEPVLLNLENEAYLIEP